MESISSNQERKSILRSWAIVVAIALSFICWGIFIFFAVGDKGQPSWDFDIVEDIPSESIYSTHRATKIFGQPAPLAPQHVSGVTPGPIEPATGGK
ncbi:hypothetical protein [Desulforhabdus amnigena]|uniref:Uncharacterized protein n=1 Tax=Desulforhabdus amnigena TaxID=40218 RepID=A0A9W6FWR1_9BACT|nr:hypothetical protein [Desulforhabdus amnigena]NLJ29884.1 hypothetical protein [Deltaproteobacteria bacterium]GLI36243.1 hypothetical protein DAMNIGENAA_36760 [Desulforhabdus amnigena]